MKLANRWRENICRSTFSFKGNNCDIENDVNILTFVFSGPENGQNRGQIGGKLGYAQYKLNLHIYFFIFPIIVMPSGFAYLRHHKAG